MSYPAWMLVGLSLSAAVARAQDGTLAAASEYFPELMPGPNVGEPALPTPPPPDFGVEGDEPGVNTGAVHLSLGLEVTSAYFYRGLRVEDDGAIFQPYTTVGLDLINEDEWSLQGYMGTWHSVHDVATGATTQDSTLEHWYESDVYFGFTLTSGAWEWGAQYGWFLSPSDAFTTVEEVQVSLAYDDSESLGDYALAPSALVIIETGEGTSDGFDKGTYAQVSIEPGVSLGAEETAHLSFPVIVGVSLSDYYEHDDGSGEAGDDDFFGFASVGATLAFDLPLNDRYGTWSAYVSANAQLLGDLGEEYNDGESTTLVVTAGVSLEY